MAKVIGLGGIFFKSNNPAKLCEWYAEHLKMNLTEYGAIEFKPDTLPPSAISVFSAFKNDTEYFNPSSKDFMINLIVDNVEEALKQAEEGGAELVGKIEEYDYGKFGWFIDPDGNKIELWKPA